MEFAVGDYVRISVSRRDFPVDGVLLAVIEPGEEMPLVYREGTKNEPRVAITKHRRYVVKTHTNVMYISRMISKGYPPVLPEPPRPIAYRHIKTLRRMS